VIYPLEEELCGRIDMEWSAQHWVHHNNFISKSNTETEVNEQDEDEDVKKSLLLTPPKFKELIGVDIGGKAGGLFFKLSCWKRVLSRETVSRTCRCKR
jgi:hypothetical protein